MDLAKMGYKACLEEGVGVLPAIQAPMSYQEASLIPKEGWAIRAAKKSYRFSDKQKSYIYLFIYLSSAKNILHKARKRHK